MKILLIKPNISIRKGFNSLSRCSPPIGLAYIAAPLLKEGFEVKILDMVAESNVIHKQTDTHDYFGMTDDELLVFLIKYRPDLVGIGGFTHQHQRIRQICNAIKSKMPSMPVILGGIHATSMPRFVLETTEADYVLQGAGEDTMMQLVRALHDGDYKGITNIDGIAYRNGEQIIVKPRTHFTEKLDTILWPARELLNHQCYIDDGVAMPVITSRSCVKRCAFCCAFLSSGKKWRYRNPDDVVDEIFYLVNRWGYENVCVFDDAANIIPERLLHICRRVAEKHLNMRLVFPSSLIVEYLTRDLLYWMKKAGTVFLSVPLEHPNDYMRNQVIGKRLDMKHFFRAIEACREHKILTMMNLVIGMPGETEETIEEVKEFVRLHAHQLDALSLTTATAFPGTKFYDHCVEKGYLVNPEKNEFLDYDTYTAHIETATMSAERIEQHKNDINNLFIEMKGDQYDEKYIRTSMRKPTADSLRYLEEHYFPSMLKQ